MAVTSVSKRRACLMAIRLVLLLRPNGVLSVSKGSQRAPNGFRARSEYAGFRNALRINSVHAPNPTQCALRNGLAFATRSELLTACLELYS